MSTLLNFAAKTGTHDLTVVQFSTTTRARLNYVHQAQFHSSKGKSNFMPLWLSQLSQLSHFQRAYLTAHHNGGQWAKIV